DLSSSVSVPWSCSNSIRSPSGSAAINHDLADHTALFDEAVGLGDLRKRKDRCDDGGDCAGGEGVERALDEVAHALRLAVIHLVHREDCRSLAGQDLEGRKG